MDKALGAALWTASFRVWDASSWEPCQYAAWAVVILAGLELMALLVDKIPPLLMSGALSVCALSLSRAHARALSLSLSLSLCFSRAHSHVSMCV